METRNQNIVKLTNYEQQSSNSNNYSSYRNSSSPESFPSLMENGIIVQYNTLEFSSDVTVENNKEAK